MSHNRQLENFIDYHDIEKLKHLLKQYHVLQELSELGYDSANHFLIDLERALHLLDTREQIFIKLYYFEGHGMESIALRMELSLGTIHKISKYAIEKLQKILIGNEQQEEKIKYTYKDYYNKNKNNIEQSTINTTRPKMKRSKNELDQLIKQDKTEQYLSKHDKQYSDKFRRYKMEYPYITINAELFRSSIEKPISSLAYKQSKEVRKYIDNVRDQDKEG